MTPSEFDIQHQLWRASRATFSPVTEPAFHHQQYGFDYVDGRLISSCTTAAAIIALARMNMINGDPAMLAQLETDLVRQSIRNNIYNPSGGAGPDAIYHVFEAIGLPHGYARNFGELKAALRVGGCAVAGIGHAQTFVEMDPTERLFKHFDPGQGAPLAYMGDLQNQQFADYMYSIFDVYGRAQVVYPPFYILNPNRGETFGTNRSNIRYPFTIGGEYWRRPY